MAKDESNASEDNKQGDETAESGAEEESKTDKDDTREGEEESEAEEKEESTHVDRDLDAEIAEEEKQGKEEKAEGETSDEEAEDDDEKPLTRGEFKKLSRENQKTALESTALTLALNLADSDKMARLVVAKWKNRGFPLGMPLDKQIKEAYAIANSDNLVAQAEEAKRALFNKSRVNKNAAGTHRDSPVNTAEPKLPEAEKRSLILQGFVYNTKTGRYEKKVNRGIVVRDPKTKKAQLLRT